MVSTNSCKAILKAQPQDTHRVDSLALLFHTRRVTPGRQGLQRLPAAKGTWYSPILACTHLQHADAVSAWLFPLSAVGLPARF